MLRIRDNSERSRRAAFSLAELVISIGVLILMMGLAGQVFTITIKSTGQATALTEVTQQLRVLEETLREDLANVQPGQSVMLIQGNPVNAYWTQAGKESDDNSDPSDGYGHIRDLQREKLMFDGTPEVVGGYELMQEPRADLLMFFTARKGTSVVDPSISSRVQQVVYGHAELGEYQPATTPGTYDMVPADPAGTGFSANSNSAPLVPAQQWHLARRSVLILPNAAPTTSGPISPVMNLQAPKYVLGQEDFVWDVDFVQDVLRPNSAPNAIGYPWFLPAILEPANQPVSMVRSQVDATPPMMMANRMGAYFAPHCASFKVEWSLDPDSPFVNGRLNGTSEVFWFDPGDKGDTQRLTFKGPDPLYSLQKRVDELKSKSDAASKALRNRLESLLCEQVVHTDGSAYSLADRFRGETCDMQTDSDDQPEPDLEWEQLSPDKERPNLAAFTALRPTGKCSVSSRSCLEDDDCPPGQTCGDGIPVADDIWPAALRITVDMYDRQGRLERPIRHVMVIPVGN